MGLDVPQGLLFFFFSFFIFFRVVRLRYFCFFNIIGYGILVMGYWSLAMDYGLWVIGDCSLPVPTVRFWRLVPPVRFHRFPLTWSLDGAVLFMYTLASRIFRTPVHQRVQVFTTPLGAF